MYTTYHLPSAQDVNMDIMNAIKTAYKSKAITITVEEEDDEISMEMAQVLDERLMEDEAEYITAENSIALLKNKYGL